MQREPHGSSGTGNKCYRVLATPGERWGHIRRRPEQPSAEMDMIARDIERADPKLYSGLRLPEIELRDVTVDRNIGVRPRISLRMVSARALGIALSSKHQPHVPGLILAAELVGEWVGLG